MSPDERFESLYRTHYGAVLRFARRRADAATAEDVTAETFAVAWRRFDRVPSENPLPWLYTTAGNELANRRRTARSDEHKATASPHELGRDPADALAERDAVLRAFAGLSETDREALRLVAWEGLSLADAARVAGTTRVAFAMRVSRARKRLAVALEAGDMPAAPADRARRAPPPRRIVDLGPPPAGHDRKRSDPFGNAAAPAHAAAPTSGADHVR